MEKRKELILNTLIKEHLKTGLPVGSEVLVSKYKLCVSPATVRNEMAELEEEGFIVQPHTSAGRVPTEKAYGLYLKNLREKKLTEAEEEKIIELFRLKEENDFKRIAKLLAQTSGQAVFWAFHRHNLFYTGIANLLAQPEFIETNLLYDISSVIDRMDEIINEIFDETEFEPRVLIGSANPFSPACSAVITKYRLDDKTGLLGILGPMRMNYERNIALVKFLKEKLAEAK